MKPRYAEGAALSSRPAPVDTHATCFLVPGLLSPPECARVIAESADGYTATARDYPASYRDNDRQLRDDAALAEWLFARVLELLPSLHHSADGRAWRLAGLNERFRLCRYRGGQSFCIHRDGAHATGGRRSQLTLMMYLNDACEFAGGATRFYDRRDEQRRELGRVRPEAGTAIVFDHALWHDGESVHAGTKLILRTDVMYERAPAEDLLTESAEDTLRGHRGYVLSLLARKDGTLVSGSRDRRVRMWTREDSNWHTQEFASGHTASVTALAESSDGTRLYSGSRDHTIRRWRGSDTRVIGEHEGAVLALASLPAGELASAGADGVVQVFSAGDALLHTRPIAPTWIWAITSDTRGALLCACEDGVLRRYSTDEDGPIETLTTYDAPLRALARSGGLLALGDARGRVHVGQLGDFARTAVTRQVHAGAVCALAFSDAGVLASCGEDDRVVIEERSTTHADFARCLAWLPDEMLASGGYDDAVRLTRPCPAPPSSPPTRR